MGTAVYFSESATNGNGKTVIVKGIYTNTRQLTAAYIGSSNVRDCDSTSYGVNGTFFVMANPPAGYEVGQIYRITMVNGAKLAGQEKSDINYGGDRSTFMVFESPLNASRVCGLKRITSFDNFSYDGTPVAKSNIRFAVSGSDLMTGESFSSKAVFDSKMLNQDGDNGEASNSRHRTAMVYIGDTRTDGNNMVLFTVFDGEPDMYGRVLESSRGMSAWDLHNYIKDKWNSPLFSIMLDGGGSTQLAYYYNGQKNSCMTTDSNGNIRGVRTMIRTPWNW